MAVKLPEHTEINKHAIDFVDGKQPFIGQIYSLGSVELKTLKTRNKTNLMSDLIKAFKTPASASILFVGKSDGSL